MVSCDVRETRTKDLLDMSPTYLPFQVFAILLLGHSIHILGRTCGPTIPYLHLYRNEHTGMPLASGGRNVRARGRRYRQSDRGLRRATLRTEFHAGLNWFLTGWARRRRRLRRAALGTEFLTSLDRFLTALARHGRRGRRLSNRPGHLFFETPRHFFGSRLKFTQRRTERTAQLRQAGRSKDQQSDDQDQNQMSWL